MSASSASSGASAAAAPAPAFSASSSSPASSAPVAASASTAPSFAPAAARLVSSSSSRAQTQWDRCLENGAIKSAWGGAIGVAAALVLFRARGARMATIGFGAGVGAGMSWLECKQAYGMPRYVSPLLTPAQAAAVAASPLCRCGNPSCKCGDACKCKPKSFASVQGGVLPEFVLPAAAAKK